MKTATMMAVLAAGLAGIAQAAEPAITWDGSHAEYFSDVDGPFTIGFQFRAETDLVVNALGAFDYLRDGFATEHPVGLWTADGGTLLATAVVPAGTTGSLQGQFRFVGIPDTRLAAGTEYVVGAAGFFGSVGDLYAGSVPVNAFTMAGGVSFQGQRGAGEAPGLNFPTVHWDPLSPATFGANFQFVAIPEPAPWTLLALGLLALRGRRRSVVGRGGRN